MKILFKCIAISSLLFGITCNAQIKKILSENLAFRKDTIFNIQTQNHQTYLTVSIIKVKQKGAVFTIVAGIQGYKYPPNNSCSGIIK